MSAEFPRSGIVFYPVGSELAHMGMPSRGGPGGEEGFQMAMGHAHPDVRPNLARQLGAATNAYLEGADVRLGTSIAVPYSASVAHEIDALRHYETGFLRVGDDATPVLGQERDLLDELVRSAYGRLQEMGLANDGLAAALRGRRFDIIAPSAIGRCAGLAVAASRLLAQEGAFDDVIAASTWVRHGQGTFVQISGSDIPGASDPATIAENHPLYTGKWSPGAERPYQHTVCTTAETGTEYVAESVIVPSGPTHELSGQQGGAIRRETTTAVTVTNKISYRLPHGMRSTTDQMATNEMEHAMSPVPDLSDGGLDMLYGTPPEQLLHDQQQTAAGRLDPATSLEWAGRIR